MCKVEQFKREMMSIISKYGITLIGFDDMRKDWSISYLKINDETCDIELIDGYYPDMKVYAKNDTDENWQILAESHGSESAQITLPNNMPHGSVITINRPDGGTIECRYVNTEED